MASRVKKLHAKKRPRINITLSPEALEVYSKVAKGVGLPLPTYIRHTLEQGLPYVQSLLTTMDEMDPAKKLLMAKGIQQTIYEDLNASVKATPPNENPD